MLTLLCRAFTERRRGPTPSSDSDDPFGRRVTLYELCLRGLLRDWREEKERREIGPGYVKAVLEVLAPAAAALFARGYEQFPEEALHDELSAALGGLPPGRGPSVRDASQVLDELRHCGVLVTTGGHRDAPLLLLHRTFHEYLAALALARRVRLEGWPSVAGLLDRKAWRPAWQEVIVLLAGQLADPEPLLRLLADRRRDDLHRHRLALAAHCLAELPSGDQGSSLVDEIADEVIRCWLGHRELETDLAVPHLTRALAAVGQIWPRWTGGGRWVSRLRAVCRHRSPRTREMASALLAGLGMGWAAPALGRLLELTRDGDASVRWSAAAALKALGPAAAPALDRLLEMSRDEHEEVRRRAADVLGQLMPSGVRIFSRPVWCRWLLGDRAVFLDELDPEQPAAP
jgi:hypothetical protein